MQHRGGETQRRIGSMEREAANKQSATVLSPKHPLCSVPLRLCVISIRSQMQHRGGETQRRISRMECRGWLISSRQQSYLRSILYALCLCVSVLFPSVLRCNTEAARHREELVEWNAEAG